MWCNKNNDEFWKAWRKRFCSHNLKSASVINGCTGDDNIRREFTEYYQSIFSANTLNADDKYKAMTDDLIKSAFCGPLPLIIDIHVLQDCVLDLKTNKASGYDGILTLCFEIAMTS